MKKRLVALILILSVISPIGVSLASLSGMRQDVKVSGVDCEIVFSILDDGTVSLDDFNINKPVELTQDQWEKRQKKVKKYRIPDTINGRKVTRIGEHAFSSFFYLQSIELPNSITDIGDYAFAWCFAIKSMKLPKELEHIGYHAFFGMNNLQKINIPDSLESTDGNPFSGNSTAKITISKNHPVFEIRDNALINKEKESLVCYLGNKQKEYSIPEGITLIEDGAFMCNWELTKLTFPDTVKRIGKEQFESCGKLSVVKLSEALEEIGDGAFAFCNALNYLYLPENVSVLGINPFRGTFNLKIEVAPENKNILIKDHALYTVENHKLVSYLSHFDQTKRTQGKNEKKEFRVSEGTAVIGENAFYDDDEIIAIILPESVHALESLAISNMPELTEIRVFGDITEIHSDSIYFNECLNSIIFLEGATEFDTSSFLRE